MKTKTPVLLLAVVLTLGVLWFAYDAWDMMIIADKACLRADNGAPADGAKAQLRAIAKACASEAAGAQRIDEVVGRNGIAGRSRHVASP